MHKPYFPFIFFIVHLFLHGTSLLSLPCDGAEYTKQINLEASNNSYYSESTVNIRYFYRPYQHHFTYKKENLFTYSKEQLKQYFDAHHYSEKDILSYDILYMSDEFVQLAMTYPGYTQAVTKLYKKLNRMWIAQRIYKWCSGTYPVGLFKQVQYLYKQLKQYQRLTHEKAQSFADDYDINLITLFPNNESLVARNIYKNYMDILCRASDISLQNYIMRDCIGQASSIGLQANKQGHTQLASDIADFCWSIIDCAAAFGEGICLGGLQTIEAITHPVETIKNSLIGIGVIAYGLAKLTAKTAECALLYVTDQDCFYVHMNNLNKQLTNILYSAQEIKCRDAIKHTAAFITEGILLTKLSTFARSTAKQIIPIAQNYFEYIAQKDPLAYLIDGPFLKIEIPKNINTKNYFQTYVESVVGQVIPSNVLRKIEGSLVDQVAKNSINITTRIKEFFVTDRMKQHIFSKKHLKGGIRDLAVTDELIIDEFVNMVNAANFKNLLKEGSNDIVKKINGIYATVRVFIKDGIVLSFDGFKGLSARTINNQIYL